LVDQLDAVAGRFCSTLKMLRNVPSRYMCVHHEAVAHAESNLIISSYNRQLYSTQSFIKVIEQDALRSQLALLKAVNPV